MERRRLLAGICFCLVIFVALPALSDARCGRHCLRCKTSTKCVQCRPGRHITVLRNGHHICTPKHTTQPPKPHPAPVCDQHCAVAVGCTKRGRGLCDGKCTIGYGMTSTFVCVACDPHCNASVGCNMRGGGLCDGECSSGYGITPMGTCIACDPHCNASIGCNRRGGGLCDGECSSGYGATSYGTCIACDPHCNASVGCNMRGGGLCDGECSSGYGITSMGTCIACDPHCNASIGCNKRGGGLCDGECSSGYGATSYGTCIANDACYSATSPLNVTSYYGVIASINYPQNYVDNSNCQWLLISPSPNGTIVLDFDDLQTEDNYDTITIYDGSTSSAPLIATISGINPTQLPRGLNSSQPYMFVKFTSDESSNYRGFMATYRTVLSTSS